MTHDPRERRLITGVTELAAWRQAVRTREDQGHEYPVVGSLYNCEFDVAVSADEDGNIHVWNVDTGHRDERFTDRHWEVDSPRSPSTSASDDCSPARATVRFGCGTTTTVSC